MPRMPTLHLRDALQSTAMLSIEEPAPSPGEMLGEILCKFRRRSLHHRCPPAPALLHHSDTTPPAASFQIITAILDHLLDHRCLLLTQPGPVVATSRLAPAQITHLQRHPEGLVVQLRLANLTGQIRDRFRKSEYTAAVIHLPRSLALGSMAGDSFSRNSSPRRFPPGRVFRVGGKFFPVTETPRNWLRLPQHGACHDLERPAI
jgi:hypothetical protein